MSSGSLERSKSPTGINQGVRERVRCEVAEWEKQIGAINLIVRDLERSKAFYRQMFASAPTARRCGQRVLRSALLTHTSSCSAVRLIRTARQATYSAWRRKGSGNSSSSLTT